MKKNLYIVMGVMLFLTNAISQNIVSINVIEKQINNGWVPQNYIVVTENSGTNGVVLFDKNYKPIISVSVVGKTRMGIPNTHDGNYRITKIK